MQQEVRIEVPEPLKTIRVQDVFYYPCFEGRVCRETFSVMNEKHVYLKNMGFCHATQTAAEIHSQALACILKIDEARKDMDYEEAKRRAEIAEIAAIKAQEKRRELIRKKRELNDESVKAADQELDVLFFFCFVIFVVSVVAFWFGAL